jgi:uncharacterized protein YebE (UPF0316 family)
VNELVTALVADFPYLPLMVFLAETCVVTVGTIRVIFIARGRKILAPILGFFEVTIWLFAIGQIMQNLSNLGCFAAFAGGFTVGNYLGVIIEKKLAIGSLVIQIATRKDATELVESLKSADYGVTTMDAQGATGPVKVVFTVIKRRELEPVVALIKHFDPKAFYAINDLQEAAAGISPHGRGRPRSVIPFPTPLSRSAA